MTILSINPYQYCPFCGGELACSEAFHFCPHCGKKLQKSERKHKKKLKKLKNTREDGAHSVTEAATVNLPTERRQQLGQPNNENSTLEEQLTTQQINVAVVSSAGELADPLLSDSSTEGMACLPALPEGFYTVILKSCPDKERLFSKLTEILRRDSFAIRLAVELIPTVLMYKSKLAEVLSVMRVCHDAGALCSIVSGDLISTVSFPQAVLAELSVSEQDLIKKSPPNLWLGETIHFAVGKVMSKGKQGLLILSNHHLYFVTTDNQKFAYDMLPLETVVSVERAERKKLTILVVRQQEQGSEHFYVSSQHQAIARLQQLLQTVVATKQLRQERPVN